MGKGDKKTRRGKLFQGTYGVRRRKNKKETYKPVRKLVTAEIKEEKQETQTAKTVKKPSSARKASKPKKEEKTTKSQKTDK